jgi:Leucine-rich repeat (LRR) protein
LKIKYKKELIKNTISILFPDLSPLSVLPFLLYLNVSNNEIEKLFDFLTPYNLKEANFSFNKITEIGNLANFHYLQTLELNSNLTYFITKFKGAYSINFYFQDNKIQKIEGLEFCQRLKNLNLAHNLIRKIEGLDNLPLVNLDLVNFLSTRQFQKQRK